MESLLTRDSLLSKLGHIRTTHTLTASVLRAVLLRANCCFYLPLLSLSVHVHNLEIVSDWKAFELGCPHFVYFEDRCGSICWYFVGHDIVWMQHLSFKKIRLFSFFVEHADDVVVAVWQLRRSGSVLLQNRGVALA